MPTHHDWKPSPASATTNTPTAAGLKMWRPRTASRYFDTVAITAASAMPSRRSGSRLGGRIMKISRPVMIEDSKCDGAFMMRAASSPVPIATTRLIAQQTRSSSGPYDSCPNTDSASAMTKIPPSEKITSMYIVTAPVTLSSHCFI